MGNAIVLASYWGGALLAVGITARTILGAIRAAAKLDRLVAVADTVSAIGEQFKNNGGSSLRDAVDRSERAIKALTHRVDVIAKDLAELKGKVDASKAADN